MRDTTEPLRSAVVSEWYGPALIMRDVIVETGSIIEWNDRIKEIKRINNII